MLSTSFKLHDLGDRNVLSTSFPTSCWGGGGGGNVLSASFQTFNMVLKEYYVH